MTFLRRLHAGLLRLRHALLPDCHEVARRCSHELDLGLPGTQRAGLRLHLWFCRTCRRYRAQLQWLRRRIRREFPGGGRARLSTGARERIKERLRKESARPGGLAGG